MLRLTVIILLLANILLAGFNMASIKPEVESAQALVRSYPQGLPTIPLMSEMESEALAVADQRQCFTIGPFETISSSQRVAGLLQEETLKVSERSTEALMELGYWVALQPFPGFAEAVEAERELRRAGLEDVAVVTGESGEFHVSLGYFLDENNALSRRDQVRELGYAAITRLQRESQPRYWLDLELDADASMESLDLSGAITPGLQRATPCRHESVDVVTSTSSLQ